jgi:hypothetical protein
VVDRACELNSFTRLSKSLRHTSIAFDGDDEEDEDEEDDEEDEENDEEDELELEEDELEVLEVLESESMLSLTCFCFGSGISSSSFCDFFSRKRLCDAIYYSDGRDNQNIGENSANVNFTTLYKMMHAKYNNY